VVVCVSVCARDLVFGFSGNEFLLTFVTFFFCFLIHVINLMKP
jgi:hypothetical protein